MVIHPTAVISNSANLGSDVSIGPYAVIGDRVTIGDGTIVGPHCVIDGKTIVGKLCKIFSGAVIGSDPQDLKYRGELSSLEVGDNNIIREYVTINSGTEEHGKTVVGSNNMIMAYSHIAHNCALGSNCVLANCATLAGHVAVEDKVVIGGLAAVHQFTRVGELSIIGGCSKVISDVSPYSVCDGHPARTHGLNLVGLRRQEIDPETIKQLGRAFKILFNSKLSLGSAITKLEKEQNKSAEISHLIEFIKSSKRGICRHR